MASVVLQPLDDFQKELVRDLVATMRSELEYNGEIQDDDRYRRMAYACWWQYLKSRLEARVEIYSDPCPVRELITTIQLWAGIDPEAVSPTNKDGYTYWFFEMRHRGWYIRERIVDGLQALWLCEHDIVLPLTDYAPEMVFLMDDRADTLDALVVECKLEAERADAR